MSLPPIVCKSDAARGYTPYGEPVWLNGTASSRYAFTGEDYDPTVGLVFLRARYMQPTLGIFLAKDPWSGNVMRSGSMNGWNYANGAPINYTDASGLAPDPSNECDEHEPPEFYTFSDETGIPLSGSIDLSTLPPDHEPSCEIVQYTVHREVHNEWKTTGRLIQTTVIEITGRALDHCFFNQWSTSQLDNKVWQGPEQEQL